MCSLTLDISVFDALGYLSNYLKEAHESARHHLADLYELVQYAGNIVPRLYLMITVGSVYMGMEEAPVKEIMRDMMEMSRGVQQPIRGLFLRHYLSGQTKDRIPVDATDGPQGCLQDSIQFILTNFIEMNKLWVRLQHQGHSRDRQLRELERTELRTLVGTNLVRLSQLEGIDITTYSETILPAILEQIIQCRDILAQEYLLEVIIQVYPDEYHLKSLDQILSAITKLNPHVNIKQVVIQLIDRLSGFATRKAEEELAQNENTMNAQAVSTTKAIENLSMNDISDSSHIASTATVATTETPHPDMNKGIPVDIKLFEIFWQQITNLTTTRSDIKIQDVSAMLLSLCNLALECYPDKAEYIDQIMEFALTKTQQSTDSTDLHSADARSNLQSLLLAPLMAYKTMLAVLSIPSYIPLLHAQAYVVRKAVALEVIDTLLTRHIYISTTKDANGVWDLVKVLIDDDVVPVSRNRNGLGLEDDTIVEGQAKLARMIHLLQNEDPSIQWELLQSARNSLVSAGERIRYTFPAIVMEAFRLIRAWKLKQHTKSDWEQQSSAVYKFIHQAITTILQCPGTSGMCLRLFLNAGQIADRCGSEETAYEFFVQAFTIYEESITDSKSQFECVLLIVSALQQTRHFSRDNYDTLATKSALHGAKLLKKPDQTRAILAASHLWWASDNQTRDDEDVDTLFRDDKRVLECLQKALKIADLCVDPVVSIQLFIEILNQYVYYFERQNSAIAPKFISGLIDLIRQNVQNLEPVAAMKSPLHSAVLHETGTSLQVYIVEHFERTLTYIRSRTEDSDGTSWNEIEL